MNGKGREIYMKFFAKYIPEVINDMSPENVIVFIDFFDNLFKSGPYKKDYAELIEKIALNVTMYMKSNQKHSEKYVQFSFDIEKMCNYIVTVKDDNLSLLIIKLVKTMFSYNKEFLKKSNDFSKNRLSPPPKSSSNKNSNKDKIDLFVVASVQLVGLFSLEKSVETINIICNMDKFINQSSSTKRELYFMTLNYLQEEYSKAWASKVASSIFFNAKIDKQFEKEFFEKALKKLSDEDINNFIVECANAFKYVGNMSSRNGIEAAEQLEKVLLITKIFPEKKSVILEKIYIDKKWYNESDRHRKAIEALFGKDE